MDENTLRIRYVGNDPANSSKIEFDELLVSLSGFSKVIKIVHKMSKINGEIELETAKVEAGSIVFDIAIHIHLTGPLFIHPQDAINFLQIVNRDLADSARAITTADGNLNAFWRDRPFDAALISGLCAYFFAKTLQYTRGLKTNLQATDDSGRPLPARYIQHMRRMIDQGDYRRAFRPFIDDAVRDIEVGVGTKTQAKISSGNFQEYLGEGEKILPEMQVGDNVRLRAVVTAVQSTHGDTLTLKLLDYSNLYVTAYPNDETTTEDYIQFYRQRVIVQAKVFRRSMYQKPKFILEQISVEQSDLLTDTD